MTKNFKLDFQGQSRNFILKSNSGEKKCNVETNLVDMSVVNFETFFLSSSRGFIIFFRGKQFGLMKGIGKTNVQGS